MKKSNPLIVYMLVLATGGIWGLYWPLKISKELLAAAPVSKELEQLKLARKLLVIFTAIQLAASALVVMLVLGKSATETVSAYFLLTLGFMLVSTLALYASHAFVVNRFSAVISRGKPRTSYGLAVVLALLWFSSVFRMQREYCSYEASGVCA